MGGQKKKAEGCEEIVGSDGQRSKGPAWTHRDQKDEAEDREGGVGCIGQRG